MVSDILQAVLAVFAMVGIITAVYFGLLKLLSIRRARKYLILLLPAGTDARCTAELVCSELEETGLCPVAELPEYLKE